MSFYNAEINKPLPTIIHRFVRSDGITRKIINMRQEKSWSENEALRNFSIDSFKLVLEMKTDIRLPES